MWDFFRWLSFGFDGHARNLWMIDMRTGELLYDLRAASDAPPSSTGGPSKGRFLGAVLAFILSVLVLVVSYLSGWFFELIPLLATLLVSWLVLYLSYYDQLESEVWLAYYRRYAEYVRRGDLTTDELKRLRALDRAYFLGEQPWKETLLIIFLGAIFFSSLIGFILVFWFDAGEFASYLFGLGFMGLILLRIFAKTSLIYYMYKTAIRFHPKITSYIQYARLGYDSFLVKVARWGREKYPNPPETDFYRPHTENF